MSQLSVLTVFRKRNYSHELYDSKQLPKNVPILDVKTGFTMTAVDHPMHGFGAGTSRGFGIRVEDTIPANTIFAISKEPLTLMDLNTYVEQDYLDNGWILFGKYACRNNELTMLANTRAPIDGVKVEVPNTNLVDNCLPATVKERNKYPPGKYVYLRSLRIIPKGSMVILANYGNGSTCLRWGQDPTVKRQQRNMVLYAENIKKRKIGFEVCKKCALELPFSVNAKKAHRFTCRQNQVNGNGLMH